MNLFLIYLSDYDGTTVVRVTNSESAAKRYCAAQNKSAELDDNFEKNYYYIQQNLSSANELDIVSSCIEHCNNKLERDNEEQFASLFSCTSSDDRNSCES